jgi:hypothetical protein
MARHRDDDGQSEEGALDERAGSGLFHRAQRGWSRHPTHPGEFVCDDCDTPLYSARRRDKHVKQHREHAEWDEEWQAEVERISDRMNELETDNVEMRGQIALFTELLGPALAQIISDRERETAPGRATNHAPITSS